MLFTLTCVSLTNTFANGSIICPVLFLNLFLLNGICEVCYVTYLMPSLVLTQRSGAGEGRVWRGSSRLRARTAAFAAESQGPTVTL